MEYGHCPAQTVRLWQIRAAIFFAVPVILFAALAAVSFWFLLPAAGFLALAAGVIFWYFPRFFSEFTIRLPQGAIVVEYGVFLRTTHIMPFSKLVYAQSIATPLAARRGLAAMGLKAARSTVWIPELAEGDVQAFIAAIGQEESHET